MRVNAIKMGIKFLRANKKYIYKSVIGPNLVNNMKILF